MIANQPPAYYAPSAGNQQKTFIFFVLNKKTTFNTN